MALIGWVFLVLGTIAKIEAASCSGSAGGQFYDLSALNSGVDIPGSDGSYKYFWRPCGVTSESVCATKSGSLCQYSTATPPVYSHMLSAWDSSAAWSACTDPINCPSGGIQATFNNGDLCGTAPRQVTFQVACKATVTTPITTFTVTTSKTNSCWYTVPISHASGCPTSGPDVNVSITAAISGGWIFIIILIVLVPIYIAAGCIYKSQVKGTHGMENCPNIDFWRDFPSLIKDGFRFTWNKLRSLCGKGDASYETMK